MKNLLIMNLSHYVRRPILIFWLVMSALTSLPFVVAFRKEPQMLTMILSFVAILGGIIHAYQMEIVSRPFAFLLPGHRRISRQVMFCINILISLLWAAVILVLWPAHAAVERISAAMLILAVSNLMFWLGMALTSKARQFQFAFGLIMMFAFIAPQFVKGTTLVQIFLRPEIIAGLWVASIVVWYIAWRRLGDARLFRSHCGAGNFMISTNLSSPQTKKMQRMQMAGWVPAETHGVLAALEQFFIRKIIANQSQPLASFIYGAIYQAIWPQLLITFRKKGVGTLALFCCFLFMGYFHSFGDIYVWLVPLFPLIGFDPQAHSTLMLRQGRLQRYAAAMATTVSMTIFWLAIISLMLTVMRPVKPYMPAVPMFGQITEFCPLSLQMWYLLASAMPVMTTVRLLLGNRVNGYYIIATILMMIAFFFLNLNNSMWHYTAWSGVIAAIVILSWATFAVYLARVCFCKSLTGQK